MPVCVRELRNISLLKVLRRRRRRLWDTKNGTSRSIRRNILRVRRPPLHPPSHSLKNKGGKEDAFNNSCSPSPPVRGGRGKTVTTFITTLKKIVSFLTLLLNLIYVTGGSALSELFAKSWRSHWKIKIDVCQCVCMYVRYTIFKRVKQFEPRF